jgi:hypothetical protein
MTDPPGDDESLTWAGDERSADGPQGPAPAVRTAGPAPAADAVTLVLLGILGGIALLETVGWVRGLSSATMVATLGKAGGDPLSDAALAVNLAGRGAAVAAPIVWYAVAAWRIRSRGRRLAWQLVGAVLLVPWPALLGLT